MSTSVFYVAPLLAAALLCGGLAGMALPHHAVPGMRRFVLFMGILVVWTLGYAAEMAVPGLEGKVVAARVQYLAIAFLGIAWLAFTTEYSGLSWWTPRHLLLALVVPEATPLMVWTNDLHGLVWPDVTLAVEVRDTGVGIPRDRLEAIFEGFVQVDASTPRRHGGAGLGLALAHRLVAHMGGGIEVSSEPGRGSSFRFEVPLEAARPGVGG